MEISSKENRWYRRFRQALKEHDSEIVLEGPKQIADAIALGWKPLAVATDGSKRFELDDRPLVLSAALFRSLSQTEHSQGLVALFPRPSHPLTDLFKSKSIVLALDGVQDPGNVGTLIRLAAAFEAGGVAVLDGSADPFGPKAIRSSAGAILTVPIVQTTAEELVALAKKHGVSLYHAEAGHPVRPVPASAAVLLLGSEGRGVRSELRAIAIPVSVQISPRVESLNVAAAAAILLAKSYDARNR